MMRNKYIYIGTIFLFVLSVQSCKDELTKAVNKNEPTPTLLSAELGLTQLAKGGTYMNGIGYYYATVDDQLGPRAGKNLGFLTTQIFGMHEAMGDVIYIPWGNQSFKFADNPTDIKLDDNSIVKMPIGVSQPNELKLRNNRAYGPSNTFLMEWTQMYMLNNAMNILLANIETATYRGDAFSKKSALTAWGHFWKGYVYSRIGSMYVAGLIVDEQNLTNGKFVTNTEILTEATKNFDIAIAVLGGVTDVSAYNEIMKSVIPDLFRKGKGGIPTPDAWIRNINTLKARNILANTKVSAMSASDWTAILNLTTKGIQDTDPVFIVKTTEDFSQSAVDPNFGSVGTYSATEDGQTFFISERLIQDFRPNDNRFLNNFDTLSSPIVNKRGRGLGFGTRWFLMDGGLNMNGVITYAHTSDYGADDIYLAGSYEENQLMMAEALIQTTDIPGGVSIIDDIRASQGAGLTPIGVVTKDEALEELRSERRIALLFRGLAFYDARRLGITDDKSKGGGRSGVVLSYDSDGKLVVNTNAFINYNYLPYFDVPQNELEYNTPVSGSASTHSPE